MKLFQTLEEKRRHAQRLLLEEMDSLKYYKKHEHDFNYLGSDFRTTNVPDTELLIEALQDYIENIDNMLREGESHDAEAILCANKMTGIELLESEIQNDWVNENAPDDEE